MVLENRRQIRGCGVDDEFGFQCSAEPHVILDLALNVVADAPLPLKQQLIIHVHIAAGVAEVMHRHAVENRLFVLVEAVVEVDGTLKPVHRVGVEGEVEAGGVAPDEEGVGLPILGERR